MRCGCEKKGRSSSSFGWRTGNAGDLCRSQASKVGMANKVTVYWVEGHGRVPRRQQVTVYAMLTGLLQDELSRHERKRKGLTDEGMR